MMYIFDDSLCDQFTKGLYFDWAEREGVDLSKPIQAEQSVASERLLSFTTKRGVASLLEKRFFKPCPPVDRPLEYYL